MRTLLYLAVAATAILSAAPLFAQTQPSAETSAVGTPIPKGAASVERLWPASAPRAIGDTFDDIPKLYCYPAPGPGPHAAVIVLPGGGYQHLVTEKEGAVEARWLNAHGLSAYILLYRLSPRYLFPAPMLDGQRAVRFVRAHAAEWNLRPDAIGVWGFSAGGHLTGYLATAGPHSDPRFPPDKTYDEAASHDSIDALSSRPDFAILTYARLDLDPSVPGTFGMKSITGPNAPQSVIDALSPVLHVTAQTSPSFLYSTEGDQTVNSQNASLFYNALTRAGVPAELHVFEQGPHGTGMGQNLPQKELAIWPTLLQHWLQLHGWMAANIP
jgi:acetyl esterase/lipase